MKIEFGEITSKTITVPYNSIEEDGYKVSGYATYNKEKKLTDANGNIRDAEGKHIANFNVYGDGEYARVNLTDCLAGMMGEAVEVAEATLVDLASSHPEE